MNSAETYDENEKDVNRQTMDFKQTENKKRGFTATTSGQISEQQSSTTIFDQEKAQSQSHKLAVANNEPLLGDNSNKPGFVKSVKSFLNQKRLSASKKGSQGIGMTTDENQAGIDIDLSQS